MKLSQKTEWALVAALIVYIAFLPRVRVVRDMLASPIGKAVALAGIVYVWKFVSQVVAVLLVVAYLRCTGVVEMFSGAEATCTCKAGGDLWDPETKTCKSPEGKVGEVAACACSSGYAWDVAKKECVAVTDNQPPVPPAAPPTVEPTPAERSTVAPATSTGTTTSSAPMTTPGAVQDMVATAPAMPPQAGGVQPGAGMTSVPGGV
jgi:hypothetical protein